MDEKRTTITTQSGNHLTAAALFIAGVALATWVAEPFFGWGAGPELGLGILTLKRVSLFGYPLIEMLGRLGAAVPAGGIEFSAAAAFAVLFGLTLVFIHSAASRISGSSAAGVLAAVSFASFAPALGCFRTWSKDGWTLFLAAALLDAGMKIFQEERKKSGLLFISLISGIGLFHSGFIFVGGLALLIAAGFRTEGRPGAAHWAAAILILASISTITAFLFLRPPLYVNWTSPLAPWLGELAPMGSLADLVFSGLGLSMAPYRLLELLQMLSGAYLPALVAACVGAVLCRRPVGRLFIILWAGLGLSGVLQLAGEPSAEGTNLALFVLFLSIAAAHGAAVLVERIFKNSPRASAAATATVCFALALIPAFFFKSQLMILHSAGSRDYYINLLKTMKRDGLFFAETKEDPLFGLQYMRQFRNVRPDIEIVYPDYLLNRAYRKFLARKESDVLTPSEYQYNVILKQLASAMPNTGGKKLSIQIRKRIKEGVISMMQENLLLTNFRRRQLYFNRIDRLFTSKLYYLMQFAPNEFLFNFRPQSVILIDVDMLARQADRPYAADPTAGKLMSVFYENVAENYFTQKKYGPAVTMLETAMKLDPGNIQARFFLGIIYKNWGRYSDSIAQYQEALRLLDRKRLHGRQESNDLFMLERIYTELNMPGKAEKFRQLISPEGEPGLAPGMSQP